MTRDQRARAAKQVKLFIDALEEFTDAAEYNSWSKARIIRELRKEIDDMRQEVIILDQSNKG
jgi:hypothetical protein